MAKIEGSKKNFYNNYTKNSKVRCFSTFRPRTRSLGLGRRAKIKHNYDLGSYLASLFEGDGHINLSKVINSKGKISYPYIAITFVNKDLPLVNKFIKLFGGMLRIKTKENAIVWTISTHKELINFINLINGYLRTPKIKNFNRGRKKNIKILNFNFSYR